MKIKSIISKVLSFVFPKTKEEISLSEIGFVKVSDNKAKKFIKGVDFERIYPDDNVIGVFGKYIDFKEPTINGKLLVVLVKLPLTSEQLQYKREHRPCYFAEVFFYRDSQQACDKNFHGVVEVGPLSFLMSAFDDMSSLYAIALSNYATAASVMKNVVKVNHTA